MPPITIEQSGAFIESFRIPPTASGPLSGLRFAVKDLLDIAGRITGCGNPDWRATHPPAAVSAVCVEQFLAAGAECVGKTITDEVAFSLLGVNHFYGTPRNAAAPDRVPGGSSSGSAAAVACGLADFALGTDTGGSVRVPAGNCGIWGLRPTHGRVSVAGVMPFAPTFDTVGVLASTLDVLARAAGVLLGETWPPSGPPAGTIHVLTEAFALADDEVAAALTPVIDKWSAALGTKVCRTSLGELCDDAEAADLSKWLEVYRILQGTEVDSCLGAWIANAKPKFGPSTEAGFAFVRSLDRRSIGKFVARREHFAHRLRAGLRPNDLVCLPTAPTVAPLKSDVSFDRNSDYYRRALSLTALSGVGRLPQLSLPVATVNGAPVGLSLIGAHGEDLFVLHAATTLAS